MDAFQITVAIGIWVACLAFIAQLIGVIALSRRLGKLLETISPVAEKAAPVLERVATVLEKAEPVIQQAGPVIVKAGTGIASAAEKIGMAAAGVQQVANAIDGLIQENRPAVAKLSSEAVEIAKSGRQQVERVGSLLTEAGDVARTRLNQIDHTVESTVEQVGEVGDAIKRAVMRPVREVNGVAAGISAAVSTLVKGSNKPSVATATQDEEMFI